MRKCSCLPHIYTTVYILAKTLYAASLVLCVLRSATDNSAHSTATTTTNLREYTSVFCLCRSALLAIAKRKKTTITYQSVFLSIAKRRTVMMAS